MVQGPRLPERVPGIPNDILDAALAVGLKEFIDYCSAPMGPGGHEGERGDDARHLRPERCPLDPVGPPDVPSLHRQVQLEADVRARRPAVGGRTVTRPSVTVDGVLLAAVRPDAEHSRLPDRPTLRRRLLY